LEATEYACFVPQTKQILAYFLQTTSQEGSICLAILISFNSFRYVHILYMCMSTNHCIQAQFDQSPMHFHAYV